MNAEDIVKKLQDSGHAAYYVGGYVRDMILGVPSNDIDIATSATPIELMTIFKEQKIQTVGQSFLVTFIDGIEVATFRTDEYNDFKHLETIKASTAEEDAKRRDFTINSLFFDPVSKKTIDHVNGLDDLENKIIRFTGNARNRIWEDPNRIIRACRFLAKINGTFSKGTIESLVKYSSYVQFVKPERIRLEIIKAMEIKKASKFFRSLHKIGILKNVLPSLDNTFGHVGGPYHIESVFDHCMMAGDHASTRYPIIKLAAYLHDIGKPISSRINPQTNDIWFQGHEKTGSEVAKTELEVLKFSNEEINIISSLIYLHMRIAYERLHPKSIRRTLKMLHDYGIDYRSLLRVAICDKMGNLKSRKKYKLRDVHNLVRDFKEQVNRKDPVSKFADLKINGNDVMQVTGLNPGKEVGEILTKLLDMVIDNPELNEKETLLELAKNRT